MTIPRMMALNAYHDDVPPLHISAGRIATMMAAYLNIDLNAKPEQAASDGPSLFELFPQKSA